MVWSPRLVRYEDRSGAVSVVLGHPLLHDYLEFVAARSRANTLLATAYDLKVFFTVVAKPPAQVTTTDLPGYDFLTSVGTGAVAEMEFADVVGVNTPIRSHCPMSSTSCARRLMRPLPREPLHCRPPVRSCAP